MTDRFSINMIPQRTGINNSFLKSTAITAMIPPIAKLPCISHEIPMPDKNYTIKNPMHAPIKQAAKITSSSE